MMINNGNNNGINNGITGWWFQTWLKYFPFHIWDVIRNPLTETMLVAIEHGHIPLLVGGDWNMAGLQNP